MKRTRLAVALAAAVVASSCSDATGPGDDLRIEIVGGDDQRGAPGWALSEPLSVRVTDKDGTPVAGISVRFQVGGDGFASVMTATTSALGLANTTWTLGPESAVPQTVTASLPPATTSTVFTASPLRPDELDLVVVRGALGPMKGIVVISAGAPLNVLGMQRATDTLMYLPPDFPAGTGVVLFGMANRPLMDAPAWTPGVDTVVVSLEPPLAVDIDVHVRTGDFERQRSTILEQLANTEGVWIGEGAGLVLGTVTFDDDTEPARDIHKSSSGICSGLVLQDAVQIDVVTSIDSGQYTGWGCWAGQIYLGDGTDRFPYLTAHELGHTFTLVHTATGMMFPNGPGTTFRDGEIFRAHFHQSSVLNTIFAGQPEAMRRSCTGSSLSCLPEDLDLGSGLIALRADGAQALESAQIGAPVDAVTTEHRQRE